MLRGGFIGFGRMGITHYAILRSNPDVIPVAVCDQSNMMMNILKKYVDVDTYSDYKEMITQSDLDFVIISTPSDSHSELIDYALDHQLHIFVEKPFALTATAGEASLKRLQGKNIVNQVGYVNRFNEVFMETKRLLESGIIGEIKNFSSEMYGATVLKDSKGSWRGTRNTGGGCLYEFGSHCIDLCVYFLGAPIRVTGSIMQSIYSSEVDDLVNSTFIYKDGLTGSIRVNWSDLTFRKPTNIVTIIGTKGKIIADKHAYKLFLKDSDPGGQFQKGWNTRYLTEFAKGVRFYLRGNEFTRQLDHFVDCIKDAPRHNMAGFSDALQTDIIIDKIIRDAKSAATEQDPRSTGEDMIIGRPKKKSPAKSIFKRIFR